MPDPTLQILQRLQNDSEWDHVERDVPIFRPHVMLVRTKDGKSQQRAVEFDTQLPDLSQYSKDGWEIGYIVSPTTLQDIAEVMSTKQQASGDVSVVKVGHTILPTTGTPQQNQPEIVGYQRAPRYGTWGPNNTPGVIVDWCIERGCKDKAKGFPFRSAEFYPRTNEITATSLLRTDPELSLGMVALSKDRGRCFHYAMEHEAPHAQPSPHAPQQSAPPQQGAGGLMGQPDAREPSPEFSDQWERHATKNYPNLKGMHEEYSKRCAPQQYGVGAPGGGGMGAPVGGSPMGGGATLGTVGPTSGAMPGAAQQPHPQPQHYSRDSAMTEQEKKDFDSLRTDMAALKAQYTAVSEENKGLNATVKSLTDARASDLQNYSRNEAESLVNSWMRDGYLHEATTDEVSAQITKLTSLTSEQRKAEDSHVRKHYQRTENPIALSRGGFSPFIDRGPVQQREIRIEASDDNAIQQYQRMHENDREFNTGDGAGDAENLNQKAIEHVLAEKKKRLTGAA
jgi:hypothetical protein